MGEVVTISRRELFQECPAVPADWETPPDAQELTTEADLVPLLSILAARTPRSVLEIGTARGLTARRALDRFPFVKKWVGIDMPPSLAKRRGVSAAELEGTRGQYGMEDRRYVALILPHGTADVEETPRASLGAFNAVYIDGDHSAAGVERDTQIAAACVTQGKGSLIIWHDYNDTQGAVAPFLRGLAGSIGADLVHVAGSAIVFAAGLAIRQIKKALQ